MLCINILNCVLGGLILINPYEYHMKYKRYVQGIISEEEFRRYLVLSLSKNDLIDIIVSGAKSLKRAVALGEPLGIEC
jgi:hypothetical protein